MSEPRVALDPAPDSEARRAKGLRLLFVALLLHGIGYTISQYTGTDGPKHELRELYETVAFLPLQLGSMYALLAASKRADLLEGTRRALRRIGFGFGALALGTVVSIIAWSVGHKLAYISWADLIYFQLYLGLGLGMRALPKFDRNTSRARASLDTVVVVMALGALIIFAAVFQSDAVTATVAERLVTALYSAAQLVMLLLINGAVERAQRTPSRAAMSWLFVALASSVVGDLVFQLMYSTGYRGANWSRASSIVANLAIVWAAIRFYEDPMPRSPRDATRLVPLSPLPILAVTSVALMIIWLSRDGSVRGLAPLTLGLLVLNVVLVVRDMVAGRDAARSVREDAHRDAALRLDALVRHSSDAILLVDPGGRLLFASTPAVTLFGVEPERLVGQPMSHWIVDDERQSFGEFLNRLQQNPTGPQSHTWRMRRGDGVIRAVESVGVDLLGEPTVGGLVLNSRDVTARLELEDRLRQAQKLEVVGHLAGGVAHDFNNVLAAILSGAELAQSVLPAEHEAQYDLAHIRAAASRGAALTRRLLTFVRLQPVPSRRVPVAEMLDEIEPLLRRLCGDPVRLTVRVERSVGTVRVDRDELEHILFNLVTNARDSMPHGGPIDVVAASIVLPEREPGTDTSDDDADAVIVAPPGRYVSISVRDEGIGMIDDARRQMFDPFFSSKTRGRGTGLGLIGVRPLIESAMGGLRVRSSPGAGTRVELLLPLLDGDVIVTPTSTPALGVGRVDDTTEMTRPAYPRSDAAETGAGNDAPDAAADTRSSSPLASSNLVLSAASGDGRAQATLRARILLVEDETAVRESVARLLVSRGARVLAVSSAAEARVVLHESHNDIDGVLCDVMMPGETGLDFANWLKMNHPTLPVLMMSGHTGTPLDHAVRESMELTLIRKPFSGEELVERLRAMLAPETR